MSVAVTSLASVRRLAAHTLCIRSRRPNGLHRSPTTERSLYAADARFVAGGGGRPAEGLAHGAQKPASWAYAEEFVTENEVIESARRRGEKLGAVPVGNGAGVLLRLLAAAVEAKSVVEVGTGAGTSGLWMLRACPRTAC